jgi:hypothetical protein
MALRDILASPHLRGLFGLRPVRRTLPNASGICCIVSALRTFGMHVHEQMLVDVIGTNAVTGFDLIKALRYLASKQLVTTGWRDYPAEMVLERARDSRITVLQWGLEPDSWRLVAGIEPIQQVVVLVDPARDGSPLYGMRMAAFEEAWGTMAKCALLIDRPSRDEVAARQLKRTDFRVCSYTEVRARRERWATKTTPQP